MRFGELRREILLVLLERPHLLLQLQHAPNQPAEKAGAEMRTSYEFKYDEGKGKKMNTLQTHKRRSTKNSKTKTKAKKKKKKKKRNDAAAAAEMQLQKACVVVYRVSVLVKDGDLTRLRVEERLQLTENTRLLVKLLVHPSAASAGAVGNEQRNDTRKDVCVCVCTQNTYLRCTCYHSHCSACLPICLRADAARRGFLPPERASSPWSFCNSSNLFDALLFVITCHWRLRCAAWPFLNLITSSLSTARSLSASLAERGCVITTAAAPPAAPAAPPPAADADDDGGADAPLGAAATATVAPEAVAAKAVKEPPPADDASEAAPDDPVAVALEVEEEDVASAEAEERARCPESRGLLPPPGDNAADVEDRSELNPPPPPLSESPSLKLEARRKSDPLALDEPPT